jgi:glycosyltransferase involved in cell wall biosynthesis
MVSFSWSAEMIEKQSPIKDKSPTMIYLHGWTRKGKIIPALNRHFTVIDANPRRPKGIFPVVVFKVLKKLFQSYSSLRKLRKGNQSLIVMVDAYNLEDLVVGVMAKFLHLPFFIRLRGGMWREIQDRWQFKPFPISQIRRGIAQFYRDQILLMVDGVIPVSYFLKNQIIYHFNTNIDFGKIMPVYNAINFAAFDETPKGNFKKKLGMTEDNKIILSVTSFNTYKKYMGIVHYLPAILRVLEENGDWYFIMAGTGWKFEKKRKSILDMVPDNLKKRIIFTGYYKPIEEAFVDSDIVVHLSFRESMSNVVLEGQAAGKPTICNDFGGSSEMLQNWHSNPCCVVKEVSELYESLKVLVNNSELRESMGRENRRAVEGKFTFESIGDDFYRCINSILGRNKRF